MGGDGKSVVVLSEFEGIFEALRACGGKISKRKRRKENSYTHQVVGKAPESGERSL